MREIAELNQQTMLWIEFTVPWYQDRGEHYKVEQEKENSKMSIGQ